MESIRRGKSDYLLNWKFLFVSGSLLLAATLVICTVKPWTWENIETIRHFMHRDMNSEVYYYYFCKIRTLLSLAGFSSICLIAAALMMRFVPRSLRSKIFPVLADEKYSGYYGGMLVFILALGCFVRLENYVFHHFWCDTLALADALLGNSLRSLLSSTLPNMQSAPPGFIVLAKILGEIWGYHELSMGLPSLTAGIISLFLFYRLLKPYYPPEVVLVMLTLFAFNPGQIFYSGEFKQYAFDVLFTILLLDCSLRCLHDHSSGQMKKTVLAGIAAVVFSHGVFCVIPPLGAMLFFYSISIREKEFMVRTAILNVVWVFALLGAAIYAFHVMPKGMYIYHSPFFAPVPRNRETVLWYWKLFQNLFCYPHGLSFPVIFLNIIPFFVILTGLVHLWKKNHWFFIGTAGPLALLLAASLLKLYPIDSHHNTIFSRLILFTTPLVFFIFAAGLECLYVNRRLFFYGTAFFSIAIVLLLFTVTFTIRWNIQPLYLQLRTGFVPGDKVYASYSSKWFIRIFAKSEPLPPLLDLPVTESDLNRWHKQDVDVMFPVRGRYWIFLSHVANGEILKTHLEKIGKVQVWTESGGMLYRLDKTQ